MMRRFVGYAFSACLVLGCNVVLGNEKGDSLELDRGDSASSCTKGFADCNGNPTDGCETNLSEPTNCGACGMTCGAGAALCVSVAGTFTCASGCPAERPTLCGYECVDGRTHANHCGGCGRKCPAPAHGEGVCRDSQCQIQCAAGFHACSDKCAAVTDPNACGDGCVVCKAGPRGSATCDKGQCGIACSPGYGNCDGEIRNGCETGLLDDTKHCGSCGRPCAKEHRCVGGFCLPLGGAASGATEEDT